MDDDYLRDRARVVRILADKADAFNKGRLLSLAERYDAMIGGLPSYAVMLQRPQRKNSHTIRPADKGRS
jgi:hypothetical protein